MMSTTSNFSRRAWRPRRTSWVVICLQTGAVLFALGLTLLYLNPFWHLDEGGYLDWRVHWWNVGCQGFMATGYTIVVLTLLAAIAAVVSRAAGRRPWPYVAAVLLVICIVTWAGVRGFTRSLDAHFEWNAADGFTVFRLQDWEPASESWRPAESSNALRSFIEIQIEPLLRGYFKLNDWQKMNGEINIKVARIIPVAWPVALGSGGETLEDPDETPLMRVAAQGDLRAVQQILAAGEDANINALDQGGQSALMLACQSQKSNLKVVQALIAGGANVNLRSRNGYTAMTWALARNHADLVRVLRKAGARP
jgi:hypothetical protein